MPSTIRSTSLPQSSPPSWTIGRPNASSAASISPDTPHMILCPGWNSYKTRGDKSRKYRAQPTALACPGFENLTVLAELVATAKTIMEPLQDSFSAARESGHAPSAADLKPCHVQARSILITKIEEWSTARGVIVNVCHDRHDYSQAKSKYGAVSLAETDNQQAKDRRHLPPTETQQTTTSRLSDHDPGIAGWPQDTLKPSVDGLAPYTEGEIGYYSDPGCCTSKVALADG